MDNITLKVANATDNSVYDASGKIHAIITANDGYIFDGEILATYMDNGGYPASEVLTVSSDGKTAEKILPYTDYTVNVTISGNTKQGGGSTDVNVIVSIPNTTETHAYSNGVLSIQIVGDYAYNKGIFLDVFAEYNDGGGYYDGFTESEVSGKRVLSGEITDVDAQFDVYINGSYELVIPTETHLSNCKTTPIIPDYYTPNSVVNLKFTANSGTQFNTPPFLTFIDHNGYIITVDANVSEDLQTAQLRYTLPVTAYTPNSVAIYGTAEAVAPIGGEYGTINVYSVTMDNLVAFAEKRFFTEDASGFTHAVNLGDYVNRLKRFYVTIPTQGDDVIKCGNYNTEVQCLQPSTAVITLDFGNVTIPSHNNNSTDYIGEISLFLPLHGFITLPSDVVGDTLRLTAQINVVSGDGVYKLLRGDDVIQIVDFTPSTDIIYRTTDEQRTIGSDAFTSRELYGLEPFVYCKYFVCVNDGDRNNDNSRAVINTFSGYNVFTDCTNITAEGMTHSEYTAIINALAQGVYINNV